MDQALRKVSEEMIKSHKVIGEEFGIANQQLLFGRSRPEVLLALGFRSGVDDLKQLAAILIQADKFGSSIAAALRVQAIQCESSDDKSQKKKPPRLRSK